MMNKNKVIAVRLSEDVYEELKKIAREEHRAISQQVGYYIEKHLEKRLVGAEHGNQ